MEFKKIVKDAEFYDPFNEFKLTKRPTEIRTDPLFGRSIRIIYFPVTLPPPPDQRPIADATKPFCPFCRPAVFEKTPRFVEELVPEGRIEVGSSVLFPNAFPYDAFSVVGVVGEEHFVPMDSFTPELFSDAFSAACNFMERVYKKYPEYRHHSINMNYMPTAGGSIIHPHIQIIAGDIPTNYQRELSERATGYTKRHNRNYFEDLVREEERLGERFIARDEGIVFLASFAPMGITEFLAIFEGGEDMMAVRGKVREKFAAMGSGIVSVLKYLHSLNFASFNMSIYFAEPGNPGYPTHLRIVPRTQLPPMGASDVNYFEMLHHEVLTIIKPEEAAEGARAVFGA
ncbi:MAG: hypothetical protein JW984_05445 [Deltaproteobacteria bacterium]|uniref:Galactose-1-phosphate uridylyltransferase n=1 Tax=Candidatus Zymogenus saltonus TaxID=2844893 RepID=A0A9D8PKL7_9DELT|nr:hypothetical protein [Candidatus Zymogenus saltonus]